MTSTAQKSKYYRLFLLLMLSCAIRPSERTISLKTATGTRLEQDDKNQNGDWMRNIFRAYGFASNISSQTNIPLCSISDDAIWQEVFAFAFEGEWSAKTIKVKYRPRALAPCGDNQLAVAMRCYIDIFDCTTLKKARRLSKTKKSYLGLTITNSREIFSLAALTYDQLAAGCRENIEIWHLPSGRCIQNIPTSSPISALTTMPTLERFLISGSFSGDVIFWRISSGSGLLKYNLYEKPDDWELRDYKDKTAFPCKIHSLTLHKEVLISQANHIGEGPDTWVITTDDDDNIILKRYPISTSFKRILNRMVHADDYEELARAKRIAFLPNHTITGKRDGTIGIINHDRTPNKLLNAHKGPGKFPGFDDSITALSELPRDMFASASKNGTIAIWKQRTVKDDYAFTPKTPSGCRACLNRMFRKMWPLKTKTD